MNNVKRIAVFGCSGTGKSTFARRLGAILGIEVFHLDTYFWGPDWIAADAAEFEQAVQAIIQRDTWILEGNYRITREDRLEAADLIIYLRASRWRCAFRFMRRCWFERSRPDLPGGCREPIFNRDVIDHLRIILTYQNAKEPQLLNTLRKYSAVKSVYELDGRAQVETFIEQVCAASRI